MNWVQKRNHNEESYSVGLISIAIITMEAVYPGELIAFQMCAGEGVAGRRWNFGSDLS